MTDFEHDMEHFGEQPQEARSGTYWWVWAHHMGKPYVLGPFSNESEANDVGYEKLDEGFEVVQLKTRDMAEATRILKARFLKGKGTLTESVRRARHKI